MITHSRQGQGRPQAGADSVRMRNSESEECITIYKNTFTSTGPFNLKKIQTDKVKYYCLYFQEKKETKALRG